MSIEDSIRNEGEFLLLNLIRSNYNQPLYIKDINYCLDLYNKYVSCGDKHLAKFSALEETIQKIKKENE